MIKEQQAPPPQEAGVVTPLKLPVVAGSLAAAGGFLRGTQLFKVDCLP